ncbi:MAG: U32 family peptidase [Bacteroidaceae bacterium]|nr:U32 family peptidase [Bacteroidaceae bacterium]
MNCQIVKSSKRQMIELLSPARNLECGIAAIDHGADAVYIGASRFGARAAAGNSAEDIRQLCDYAHQFGAKVYVAVNTLLHEDEKEQARQLVWDVYRVGADAIIVQDLALLEMDLPPIPLHASTQMDNQTEKKVSRLNELGFNQIVLARELTLEQIRNIHKAVPEVSLEVFVHGALCVSYSGRCYASEYCFGRSANRGECAQFCRLPFSLEDAEGKTLIKDKYLLSLRDMNRIAHLEEMMDSGVRSFKIEGRLKDVSYVKNVTAAYRQAIDAILERRPEYKRSSYGTSTYSFQPDLSRSFSRGATNYFLYGRTHDLAEPDTPKSRGREVGHVKEVRNGCIIVSSPESFCNGDGLCFFDADKHLQGFRVNRAEGNHLYPSTMPNVRKGDRLWRSYDKIWEDLMAGKTAQRRISARFMLEETEEGFRLTLNAEDGTSRSMTFAAEHQPARTDQTNSIKDVLRKLGDTPYVCKDVEINFSQPWFIPRSTLADWRRKVSEGRERQREENTLQHLLQGNSDYQLSTLRSSPIPPLMTCRFCLRHAWGQCKKDPSKATPEPCLRGGGESVNCKLSNSKWNDPLFLVLGDGRRFRLEFDCKKCEMMVLK